MIKHATLCDKVSQRIEEELKRKQKYERLRQDIRKSFRIHQLKNFVDRLLTSETKQMKQKLKEMNFNPEEYKYIHHSVRPKSSLHTTRSKSRRRDEDVKDSFECDTPFRTIEEDLLELDKFETRLYGFKKRPLQSVYTKYVHNIDD